MKNFLDELLPNATTEDIINSINSADALFSPFFYPFTDDDKIGLRTMAEGREGYARMVSKIASANPDDLARQDNAEDLVRRLFYDENLESIRQKLIKLTEKVTETQTANSADIMKYVDAYVDSLQGGRKRNSALDAAMRDVDDWNKRFGRTVPDKPIDTPENPDAPTT